MKNEICLRNVTVACKQASQFFFSDSSGEGMTDITTNKQTQGEASQHDLAPNQSVIYVQNLDMDICFSQTCLGSTCAVLYTLWLALHALWPALCASPSREPVHRLMWLWLIIIYLSHIYRIDHLYCCYI